MTANERNEWSRRSILKTGATTLAGFVGASGVASAKPGRGPGRGRGRGKEGPPDHSAAPEFVKEKNDRFELTASRSEWNDAEVDASDVPADTRPLPYGEAKNAMKEINEALDNGDLDIEERGGRRQITVQGDLPGVDGGDS